MERVLIASGSEQASDVLVKLVREMYSGCRISAEDQQKGSPII